MKAVRPRAPKAFGVYVAASLGFEPRQRDPESLVLPLHHEANRGPKRTARFAGFASGVESLLVLENYFFALVRSFHRKLFPALLRNAPRLFQHGIDHGVVVIGIVMEKEELADTGVEGERNSGRDRAVAPADVTLVFFVGVLRI